MNRLRFGALAAAAALSVATAPTAGAAPAHTAAAGGTTAVTASSADPAAADLLAAARRVLDSRALAHKAAFDAKAGLADDPLRAQVADAIDPGSYTCEPTEFSAWLERRLAPFTAENRQVLSQLGAYDLPSYDALLFGSENDPAYALGADAKALTKTFRTLQRFWDVDGSDIDLMAMHGSMLLDAARVSRAYQVVYGVDKAAADDLAARLVAYLANPVFEGGNHPIFTLNAFAFTSFGRPVVLGITPTDRIVMGDGVLQANRELGYGDVAPQVILAHEYGHHVQFETGMIVYDTVNTPESTRRTELHADASSAYFLSHPRGASMQFKRVRQFLPVYYDIGDCKFTSNGHHGTPNQRLAAATWAYELQEAARPKGKVLPARTFRDLFDAQLPTLVAPDRP